MKTLFKPILILVLLLWTMGGGVLTASAEIPHLINYQGKLTETDGSPITATKQITFRIYDVLSGGTPLWEETQSITINKGVFNTMLGSTVDLNLPFNQPYYLEIKVDNEVMTPRQRIASAGYAFRAEEADYAFNAKVSSSVSPQGAGSGLDADTLDGKHDSEFVNEGISTLPIILYRDSAWTLTGAGNPGEPGLWTDGLHWTTRRTGESATGKIQIGYFKLRDYFIFSAVGWKTGAYRLKRKSDNTTIATTEPPDSDRWSMVTLNTSLYKGTEAYFEAEDTDGGGGYAWNGFSPFFYVQ